MHYYTVKTLDFLYCFMEHEISLVFFYLVLKVILQ